MSTVIFYYNKHCINNMQRNNTNLPEQLYSSIKKYNIDEHNKLHYYQQIVLHVFKNNVSKGICINHHMGSGKSITAVAIIDYSFHELKFDKIFFISPVSLKENIIKAVNEYNEIMQKNLDPGIITFISKSHTMAKKLSEKIANFNLDDKLSMIQKNLNVLDNALVIFEEAHLVMQLISNGSPGAVALYELIMRSPNIRIIMLTGTIINSRPFELVPMFNLLSGKKIFPEIEDVFLQYFWDRENKQMINRSKFQNRIFGLVSRIDASHLDVENKDKINYYPKLFDMEIIKVPMSQSQLQSYLIFREEEVQESLQQKASKAKMNVEQFGRKSKKSTTYRVRTRQISNYNPPRTITSLYVKTDEAYSKLDYDAEKLDQLMQATSKEERESPKYFMVDQLIKKHANQKGIIHSSFTGVGGGSSLGYFLESHGYTRLKYNSALITLDTTTYSNKTFSLLNASIPVNIYNKIFALYNSEENDYGKLLPIIIIADREALGLDLKCVRYGIMLGPVWIYSLWDQFVHRMKRYKSHLRLKPVEQNCVPYLFIASYPSNFSISSIQTNMTKSYELTTDESILNLMLGNRDFTVPFTEACYEVSIECKSMQEKFPSMICRTCAPNNSLLYSDDNKNPPYKNLAFDINEPDPCQQIINEEIETKELKLNIDGIELTFYYVQNNKSIEIYYLNESKNIYEQLLPIAPSYKTVLEAILALSAVHTQ